MIIALSIFALTLAGKLTYDRHRYLSRKTIYHGREAVIVFIMLVGASYFAGWISAPMWFLGFWILFNGFFNILIGQKWGYKGETAKLDQLERRYPWITTAKIILFLISIIVYLIFKP